jgi:hypothetical protein
MLRSAQHIPGEGREFQGWDSEMGLRAFCTLACFMSMTVPQFAFAQDQTENSMTVGARVVKPCMVSEKTVEDMCDHIPRRYTAHAGSIWASSKVRTGEVSSSVNDNFVYYEF